MGLGRVEGTWTKCVNSRYLVNRKDVFWAFMDLEMANE